jgi:zinc protease
MTTLHRSRLLRWIASIAIIALASAPLTAQSSAAGRALSYTRFVLPNGLTAILNEDHATPIVALDLYYRIGSRDDKPGRAGIAHFCEHMMGEGSPNLAMPQSVFAKSLGAVSTHIAATTEDITHYYYTIPSNQLETVLWMEGDRMAHPFSRSDSQQVAAVRGVVAQERLTQVEAVPYGLVRDAVEGGVFPDGPYHMSATSPMADLPNITAAAIRESCAPYYVPNNAVLALSGDFRTTAARAWVEKYFGGIPRGVVPPRTPVAPQASSDKRLVLEDGRITTPRLLFEWVGASYANKDRIPLLALASTLSLSRFALDGHFGVVGVQPPNVGRLSRALIQDRQLATQVVADNLDNQQGGIFEIAVFPRAGASLSAIETVVDSVLADLRTTPVSNDELARFNKYNDVLFATSIQQHFMRADTLAHDEIFAGSPRAYADQIKEAHALTTSDIDGIVRRYLGGGHIVLSVVPMGKLNLAAKPELGYTNVTPSTSSRARP